MTIAIVVMTRLSTRNWVSSCRRPAPMVLRIPTSRLRPERLRRRQVRVVDAGDDKDEEAEQGNDAEMTGRPIRSQIAVYCALLSGYTSNDCDDPLLLFRRTIRSYIAASICDFQPFAIELPVASST